MGIVSFAYHILHRFPDLSGLNARKHKLNISRITEQALLGILNYLETQNNGTSSQLPSQGSFLKESCVVPRARFEPATTRSSASPSNKRSSRVLSQAELPRHTIKIEILFAFLSFRKRLKNSRLAESRRPRFHRTTALEGM